MCGFIQAYLRKRYYNLICVLYMIVGSVPGSKRQKVLAGSFVLETILREKWVSCNILVAGVNIVISLQYGTGLQATTQLNRTADPRHLSCI